MTDKPKPCPACGGDGGWDVPYAICHITGEPITKWRWCQVCNAEDDERPEREEWPSIMDGADTPFAENH